MVLYASSKGKTTSTLFGGTNTLCVVLVSVKAGERSMLMLVEGVSVGSISLYAFSQRKAY